jgi:hypothetical protein
MASGNSYQKVRRGLRFSPFTGITNAALEVYGRPRPRADEPTTSVLKQNRIGISSLASNGRCRIRERTMSRPSIVSWRGLSPTNAEKLIT